jgi:hypothetical protein
VSFLLENFEEISKPSNLMGTILLAVVSKTGIKTVPEKFLIYFFL